MKKNIIRTAVLLLGVGLPLLPLQLYLAGNWYALLDEWTIAMVLGLVSYSYFLEVLALSARIRFLDRLFGHDRVMRFHALLALFGLGFALLHRWFKLRHFDIQDTQILLGNGALILYTVIIGLTLLFMVPNILHRIRFLDRFRLFFNRRIRLDYTFFKILHNLTALAVILMSVHVLLASSTQENSLRQGVMAGLFALALLFYIWHKALRPLLSRTRSARVTAVHSLHPRILQLDMSLPNGQPLVFRAGQYGFFRFFHPGLSIEEHPFSLSSKPGDAVFSITVKELGDYTGRLRQVMPGDRVSFDGPYGAFSPSGEISGLLFLAGGIGITPVHSILQDLLQKKTSEKITLVWACERAEELIYHEQYLQWSREYPHFQYIPLLRLPEPGWEGRQGLLTRDFLQEILRQLPVQPEVFLCGPPVMMRLVTRSLRSLGIRRIHSERFSL